MAGGLNLPLTEGLQQVGNRAPLGPRLLYFFALGGSVLQSEHSVESVLYRTQRNAILPARCGAALGYMCAKRVYSTVNLAVTAVYIISGSRNFHVRLMIRVLYTAVTVNMCIGIAC